MEDFGLSCMLGSFSSDMEGHASCGFGGFPIIYFHLSISRMILRILLTRPMGFLFMYLFGLIVLLIYLYLFWFVLKDETTFWPLKRC
mgnify:CR=1 FL=1